MGRIDGTKSFSLKMRSMANKTDSPNRRAFLKSAVIVAASCALNRNSSAETDAKTSTSLFNGKTLDGWIQAENSATAIGSADIADFAALAKKLRDRTDAVSAFLDGQLDDKVQTGLRADFTAVDTKAARSALAKDLTRIISGASLYETSRFQNVQLRPETQTLLQQPQQGRDLIHLNRMLLEDAFPSELSKCPSTGWMVKDGAMASTGAGRGVIYTMSDYHRFRLRFTMRHVSGNPDHQACVLIFCTRPQPGEIPLDALGGIQFQVPKGGHWDYRPGHNNAGGEEFSLVTKPEFDPGEWSRVEILADPSIGAARMAVAQPTGSKAVEVLNFRDPSAGKVGPIAFQMHNAGLFDEYKDVVIDANPNTDELAIKD